MVTPPTADEINKLGKEVVLRGGRQIQEAHADRAVTMSFNNGAVPGTRIRKQIPRAECRRRAQVMLPQTDGDEPLRVCVVCDSVHRWPSAAAVLN